MHPKFKVASHRPSKLLIVSQITSSYNKGLHIFFSVADLFNCARNILLKVQEFKKKITFLASITILEKINFHLKTT